MSITTLDLRDPVDRQIRHVRDLIFVRDLLARRGADAAELAECDSVIDEQRDELARIARAAAAELAVAA